MFIMKISSHKMVCLLAFFCLNFLNGYSQDGFVKVRGSHFEIDGQPYCYIGANYWYGSLLAAIDELSGKERLQREMDFLASKGINNLRVLLAVEGQSDYKYHIPFSAQPEQGVFDEHILQSLDFFLDQAAKHKIKIVFYFTNNWEWSGGFGQYLQWNGYGDQVLPMTDGYSWEKYCIYNAQFYNCKPCWDAVNKYISTILNRKNTFNGILYKDDPTIMAWELANEPRPMDKSVIPAFCEWIHAAAAYIKSIDPNHLVTTGNEGEMGSEKDIKLYKKIHDDNNIDYLTIHIWPKNWRWFNDTAISVSFDKVLSKSKNYIERHVEVAMKLNKPLVIEEFGLPRDGVSFNPDTTTSFRDKYYKWMFGQCLNNFKQRGPIGGCNFWGFGGMARPQANQLYWKRGDDFMTDPPSEEQGLNSVFDSDASTWNIIEMFLSETKDCTKTIK
jgi:mannan endo-1,4-beta-mannosidase